MSLRCLILLEVLVRSGKRTTSNALWGSASDLADGHRESRADATGAGGQGLPRGHGRARQAALRPLGVSCSPIRERGSRLRPCGEPEERTGRSSFCPIYGEEEHEERGDEVVCRRFVGGGRGGPGGDVAGRSIRRSFTPGVEPIHPSAWKGNSPKLNFRFTEFSEVQAPVQH